ncbi:MAG: hypothetical protein GY816_11995 [Cytophagales bacterium]|nr:hypothetical protein [Cytophagales bacterium]
MSDRSKIVVGFVLSILSAVIGVVISVWFTPIIQPVHVTAVEKRRICYLFDKAFYG